VFLFLFSSLSFHDKTSPYGSAPTPPFANQAIFGTALASPRELAKRSTVNGVVAGGLEIIDEAAAAAAAAAAAEEGRALGPHGDGSLAMAAGLEALIMDPAAAPEEKFAAGEAFAVGSFARETVQRLR